MTPDVGTPEPRTVVLADGRGGPGQKNRPTRRVFTRMAVGTAVTLVTIVVGGYFASVRLAERQVLASVRTLNEAVAHTLLEPTSDRLRDGDAAALAALDDAVREHLLPNSAVERVKVWAADGRIVYSDRQELIGRVYPLGDDELEVLRSGASSTDVSDLSADENESERADGETRLFEVYTGVPTDSGENLLFEAYVRYDVLEQRQDEILAAFSGIGLVGLGLLAVSQLWLATANLRWLQRERTHLAKRSAEVVEEQRRRVARELHDGIVQDLLGAAYLINGGTAPLRAVGRDAAADALADAQATIRTSIRSLRSLLIDLYPANLRNVGLRAALFDLIAPFQGRGTEVYLDLPEGLDLPEFLEAALYRAAREAVSNASRSGGASNVWLGIRLPAEHVELVVTDDGAGFDPSRPAAEGHLGLRTLADEAEVLAGVLELTSAPGRGTVLRLVLPR